MTLLKQSMTKPLILTLFFLSSSTTFAAEPTPSTANTIRILELKGTAAEMLGTIPSPLKVGSIVHEGRRIKVGKDSMVLVSLGKDVVTKLGPEAEGQFSTVHQKDWLLKLDQGITASAVRNPEKRENHFQVHAHGTVMGVRGTVFYIEDLKDKPLFLCTCKGTVDIRTATGKEIDSVTATHHDRPLTFTEKTGGGAITANTAPMGNAHSDADVQYLENILKQL